MIPVKTCLPLFLVLIICIPIVAYGQGFTGEIAGTISDPTQAVTNGATVRLTSKTTGGTKTIKTSSDGSYQFVDLPPASYTIKAGLTGFKTTMREVVLNVAQKLRVRLEAIYHWLFQSLYLTRDIPALIMQGGFGIKQRSSWLKSPRTWAF